MTYSAQSKHRLAFVTEADYGITPANPDMGLLRHTACDLSLNKTSIESDEIRDDRHIRHFIPGQNSVTGGIEFEMNYGGYDDLFAAALYANWSGNVLKTGAVPKSFGFERGFMDIGQYQLYRGCVLDELTLTVQPGSLITGRFAVIGQSMSQANSPADMSVTPGSSNAPMDSFNGSIWEGGSQIALIAGLDLKIENDVEQIYVLGEETAHNSLAGRSRVSGEITAYFEDETLINKFLNNTPSSLQITLSGAGGLYQFDLPNILYTGAQSPVRGDRVVTISLPFIALYDEGDATNIKITRAAT